MNPVVWMTSFSVKRPQFTLVAFIALLAMGVSSFFSIPKAEDPTFPSTIFAIIAVLPGASPSEIERLVVDPIEAKVKGLSQLKSIKTDIEDSVVVIRTEFFSDADGDRKRDELERETSALRPSLPAELLKLEVLRFDPSTVSVLQLALVSDNAPYRDLESHARRIEKRLENVSGCGDVTIWGLPKQEIEVALDVERLASLRLSPLEVMTAINKEGTNIPGGSVVSGGRQFNVKTNGYFTQLAEIENVVVRPGSDRSLRLRDVARVRWQDGERGHYARYNGRRAIFISVPVREHQDIFSVTARLKEETNDLRSTLPATMTLEAGFDQSHNVRHRLTGFLRDFGLAIALVLLTLLPLGLRASAVVMVSVPLSIAMGAMLLEAFGFTINQLSIVGFVIALGLLVDDSVVVVENIARFLREGYKPVDAALAATKQITVSVLGCTATLIIAFLPLLFLPGQPGRFIQSLPVAVVLTVASSLFVSLTIVPFLSSRLLVKEKHEGNRVLQLLMKVIELTFRPVLHRALLYPRTTLALSLVLAVSSAALIPKIGFSLFPKANLPQFLVTIDTPEGTSQAEVDRAAVFVEQELRKHAEIENVMTTIGKSNPMIYYNVLTREEHSNYGEVFVQAREYDPTKSPKLYSELRQAFEKFAGARIELKEFENGPPLDAPVAFRVLGGDPQKLVEAATMIERELSKTPGTTLVRNIAREKRTDVRVAIDHEKAALSGVSPGDANRTVRLAIAGTTTASFRPTDRDDEIDVRLILEHPSKSPVGKPAMDVFDHIYLPTASGLPVALRQVAELSFEGTASMLRHHNRERAAVVTAQVLPEFNTDKVTNEVSKRVFALTLPEGTRVVVAGEQESRTESLGGLGGAIVATIFGIMAVLVLEFRTFRQTLIVASVIPFGIAGGLVALYLSGDTLSFTANIGFVALMGIEVKNSILLVDFTNQLRSEGMPLDEAIEKAGEIRFLPILLTTATALGGLVPLALERSPLYSPLALVLIGGLISSTLLARVVTPVLYKLLAPSVASDEEEESLSAKPQQAHG